MISRFPEAQDVDAFHGRGFLFPLGMMPKTEAAELRRAVEDALDRTRDVPNIFESIFNVPHIVMPEVHELISDSRVLDPAESVMGPDILLWNAGFIIKEPHTADYAGWHQDMRCWGLDDDSRELTTWIAVGDVTEAKTVP